MSKKLTTDVDIDCFNNNDPHQFRLVYLRHQRHLHYLALQLTKSRELSQDIVADTVFDDWEKLVEK